jgi:hypothetical protein
LSRHLAAKTHLPQSSELIKLWNQEASCVTREKALTERWFEEVWNKGRAEAIREMVTEDLVVHGLSDAKGEAIKGVKEFDRFHSQFVNAFPNIRSRWMILSRRAIRLRRDVVFALNIQAMRWELLYPR